MKNKIMNLAVAMLSVAFLLTGCSEEDFPQPQQSGAAGTLHIASISIDGQQVKSRAVADDGIQYGFNEYAYNQSLNSFANGDRVGLQYRFTTGSELHPVDALFQNGQWTIVGGSDVSVWLRPDPTAEAEMWENIYLSAEIKGSHLSGEEALALADDLDFVAGDISDEDVCLMSDALIATSNADEQSTKNYGAITIDNDITSPNLGAMTIELKHVGALLRLSKEAVEVEEGTYIVDGSQYNATGLATLWAALYDGLSTRYYPLTEVGENLQAILQVGTSGDRKLTGFKAVMKTDRENQYFTLDLPFTVETQASVSDGMALQSNYCYPLTLNISPNSSSVKLSGDGLGKPGWGEDEDETTLDNGLNEAKNELSYSSGSDNNAGTFSVSGPYGLMLLNMWMTGTLDTDAFVATGFSGATDITDAINPLAQNITITDDITLPNYDGKSNWTRLGNADKPYTGTIDGGNYTLTGLLIRGYATFQGFVGYLGEGGKVKNLTFKDAKVLAFYDCVGIVAGQNRGIVENCHTTGNSLINIFDYFDDVRCYVGGIVGFNDGMISACINNAEINADGVTRIGGVVGLSSLNDVVIACGNTAMVNDEKYSGGIVGENDGTVTASWTQTTNEKNHLGEKPTEERKNGVGCEDNQSIITACHVFSQASAVEAEHITTMNIAIAAWNATNSSKAVEYGWKAATTTSGQWPSLALITELSDSWPVKVEDLYKVGTDLYTADGVKLENHGVLFTDGTDYYTAAGKKLESLADFYTDGTDYYTSAGVKVEGFELANSTATVSTANALLLWNAMAQTDLDLNLTLTADIELTAPAEGQSNWTPVGKGGDPYSGTIDGAGKTLTGMVINASANDQGFVGVLGEGGKVQNLTFKDAQVTSTDGVCIAIVVGRMEQNTIVENCHTTGISSVEGPSGIGGIVGDNFGGAIISCTNAAQVQGDDVFLAGGIVSNNGGMVSACTNSGAVSADVVAGGIVGFNYNGGTVIACGNTGVVSGDTNVGGIVGSHNESNVIASWTQDTNEKDSDGNAPALGTENGVGGENGGSITACHVFSQASSVTAEHITGMNIAIAAWNATDGNTAVAYGWKAATTSGQWPSLALITELSDSWPVKEGGFYKIGTDYYTATGVKVDPIGTDFYIDGTDYYTAAGEKVEGFALADGTATVSTANALLLWNAMAQTRHSLNLTLTADITLPQPAEGGSNWTPVGVDEYTGTINGGGHTLTGMVINANENNLKNNLGFVGNLNDGGKVQNLTFADATVISSSGYSIGIVVGLNKKSTVENCHTTGSSSVKGYATVGGIVGSNQEGFVSACINRSAVSATVINEGFLGGVGGIVGDNQGDVIACGNTGVVSGYINVGGIVGNHYEGNVIASWTQDTNEKDNDGNAPSSTENGVGQEWDGIITACHVFSQASDVTTELISDMNKAIEKYNYRWEAVTDGYPTLKTVTE